MKLNFDVFQIELVSKLNLFQIDFHLELEVDQMGHEP